MKHFRIRYKESLPTYYIGDQSVPLPVFLNAIKECETAGMKRLEDYTTQSKLGTITYEHITYG